jgi:alpha-N-arabinofuranosidase
MNRKKIVFAVGLIAAIFLVIPLTHGAAGTATITVQADKPGAKINPMMWGIFFEDINFGADGGLYAEMIKNRSFEFPNAMMGWSKKGDRGNLSIRDVNPFEPANPHYLRIEIKNPGDGFGVTNEGFRGIGLRKGEKYWFSVYARGIPSPMAFKVEVIASDGRKIAEARFDNVAENWQKYIYSMEATDTDAKAKLNLLVTSSGVLDVDMVSLFPEDSAVSSPLMPMPVSGLRNDLVQMLADLKPGFLRFPGGCIVEGRDIDNRYQWKNTIGDINKRKLIISRWNNEFDHRYTEDYFQSFGLGFYEFFSLCEKIVTEPMPIINCGMACQFNTAQLVPMDQLQPYVQDALDLIEFANGPSTSQWGGKRVEMGHTEPFNLKMLGIGNEQWGPQYIERYNVFAKAIKEKYPDMKLIVATGSDPEIFPNGPAEVKFLWSQWRKIKPDIVDEHFYRGPEWFLNNADYYDNYGRKDSKIFVGEYAAQSVGVASPDNRNNWLCALAEAAFMTGLERNADLVVMSCYAPLFGQVDGWQWTPDLIWFDNLRVFGTPNYYVQQLFSLNRGDVVLPVQLDLPSPVVSLSNPLSTDKKPRFYATACREEKSGDIILKVVNATAKAVQTTISLNGAGHLSFTGMATTITADPKDENSLDNPKKISPVSSPVSGIGPVFAYKFKPHSLTVLRLSRGG